MGICYRSLSTHKRDCVLCIRTASASSVTAKGDQLYSNKKHGVSYFCLFGYIHEHVLVENKFMLFKFCNLIYF
jgi:hypothetical protein